MQTWATLAAKHAVTSGIGLGAIPAMGWDSLDGFAVGVLLAGVGLAALNSPRRVRSCTLPPDRAARDDRAQATGAARGRLTRARRQIDGVLTGMLSDDADQGTQPVMPWDADLAPDDDAPAVTEPADARGGESGRGDRGRSEGEGFWGPGDRSDAAVGGGYRSKHRLAGPAPKAKSRDGRRSKPRHAAPPASLGVTLGRRLTSPRLTNRSAAHAAS